MRVLVTGANGFVGRELCASLAERGHVVRAAVRAAVAAPPGATQSLVIDDIGSTTDWSAALRDIDAVVHAAARVHVMNDSAHNEELYMETNARGTRRLAQAAASCGVRRMVFLSSIKVNGEGDDGRIYKADDDPAPHDAYGRSKWQAENHLFEVSRQTRLEAVVVRSPLVYGPGVRANFLRLMEAVARRTPLPLGALSNRRSLVNVWNLTDLLGHALQEPAACGRVWLAADPECLSTPELVRRLAHALGVRPRLLPIPEGLLRVAGLILNRRAEVARLCGSLELDITSTLRDLRWVPPVSVEEGLSRTAAWFRGMGRGA